MENLHKLIESLIEQPNETTWLEFKHNNYTPEMIGKDICALANGAALAEKNRAYMVWRIIDNPPKSRNEKLAELMRRLRMCEELGTGWDKIAISCELFQLPAPQITAFKDSTRVVLYSEIPFSNIPPADKLWA